LTGAKTDERETAVAMIGLDPALDGRPGQVAAEAELIELVRRASSVT